MVEAGVGVGVGVGLGLGLGLGLGHNVRGGGLRGHPPYLSALTLTRNYP